jgi:tetratricopeptide (TPR) repeat protein
MKKILLFLSCLTITGAAQEVSLQDLVSRKQFAEVINRAKHFTAADSADYISMYAAGQAYEGMLRYPVAYNYFRHCLAMDTTNIDVLNTLARLATNIGKAADAKLYFGKVLEKDSMDFYANYQLARLHQQLGEYEAAIEKYRFLQGDGEDNPVLLRNMGDCYTRMDSLQGAALCYFRAYNVNRENASLGSALINTLLRMGEANVPDALALCDTALYYNPGNKQLLGDKGMALYMNKQYLEADTLYTQLVQDGDSTFLTVKYLGVCRYYGGKFINAIEPLEITWQRDTTAADVSLLLGSALGKTYDRKRAFALLNRAEELMKPDRLLLRQLLLFRAETYQKDGSFDMADKLYYQAWKEEPENLGALSIILSYKNFRNIEDIKNNDTRRAKAIFIRILYLQEYLKAGKTNPVFYYHRNFLESLYNDMFFRSATEEPMLSPDGKRSNLSINDLRDLINQLPDTPPEE